jgi:hypothetical protein
VETKGYLEDRVHRGLKDRKVNLFQWVNHCPDHLGFKDIQEMSVLPVSSVKLDGQVLQVIRA